VLLQFLVNPGVVAPECAHTNYHDVDEVIRNRSSVGRLPEDLLI